MQTRAVLTSVALVALLITATECRVARHQPLGSFACFQKFSECSLPSQNLTYLREPNPDYRAALNHIDETCVAYESTAECFRPSLPNLCNEDMQDIFNTAFSVGDFLCSAEGKSLINQFKQSVCFTDPTKILEVQGYSELCTIQAVNDAPELNGQDPRCQVIRDILACTVRKLREECGNATAKLAEEISSRILPVLTGNECSVESATEELKRRFSAFIKRGW